MLIIEGPDGGGKTTLVERLHESLSTTTRPRSSTSDHGPVPDLMDWLDRDFRTNVNMGIYDRHPLISETIYGPLVRGVDFRCFVEGDELMEMFHQLYSQSPLLIVYCLPSIEAVRLNVLQNHQGDTAHLEGVRQHIDALYAAYMYRYHLDASRGVALRWNYEDPSEVGHLEIVQAARPCCSGGGR